MFKVFFRPALLVLLLVFGTCEAAPKTKQAKTSNTPTADTAPVAVQQARSNTDANVSKDERPNKEIIIPPSTKDRWDKASVIINGLLAVIGFAGICVARSTLNKIERQTKATEIQATHMVDSERPFIIVDTRGTMNREFWMTNHGKSPAQIVFIDPVLTPRFHEWDESRGDYDMPGRPEVGPNYWDDRWEQINVPWLGPVEERCFFAFDIGDLQVSDKLLRKHPNDARNVIRIVSGIKYKGMFSSNVYRVEFCYGWGPSGMFMTGPDGYNKYT